MPKRAPVHNPFRTVVRKHMAAEEMRREHDRQHERLNPHQRGYNREWRKVSKQFLQAHPLCTGFDSLCEERGKRTASTDVDHVLPHRGNLRLFWDQDNWQALCHTCHARKTAREDGGFGRPVRGGMERASVRGRESVTAIIDTAGTDLLHLGNGTTVTMRKRDRPKGLTVTVHGSMQPQTARALARAALHATRKDHGPGAPAVARVLRGYEVEDT